MNFLHLAAYLIPFGIGAGMLLVSLLAFRGERSLGARILLTSAIAFLIAVSISVLLEVTLVWVSNLEYSLHFGWHFAREFSELISLSSMLTFNVGIWLLAKRMPALRKRAEALEEKVQRLAQSRT